MRAVAPSPNHRRAYEPVFIAIVSLVYLYLATHFRTSTLRQDWWWSLRHADFASYALDGVSGWSTAGLGDPVAYPTGYVAALVLLVGSFLFSPPIAQGLYLVAVAAACAAGGLQLAGRGADSVTRAAIVFFAVFNPWVYTETVAGHFYMILAYAATMFLFGEFATARYRPFRLAFGFLALVSQLQFVFVPLAVFAVRFFRRKERLPLAYALTLLLPAMLGIVLEYGHLIGTPYLLEWERGASVAPLDALRLLGYFTHYGARIALANGIAMDAALALAVLGLCFVRFHDRRAERLAFAALALAATMYATGSRGPLAPFFEWLVLSVPASGLFRELYDLIAYTAIAYIVLASVAARRFVFARYALLVVGAALGAAWFFDPPSGYTVALRDLPAVSVRAPEHTRYALFPAFQPFTFAGRGSGLDPDAFRLPGDRWPLDEFVPSYPADVALARYARSCDARLLGHLSVAVIVVRPWLRQDGTAPDGTQCPGGAVALRDFLPVVGLSPLPAIGTLDADVGAGNVFFADEPGAKHGIVPVVADRRFARSSEGWIDARLTFTGQPDFGQAFGGAMTSSTALLPVRPGLAALVDVHGALRDQDGRMLVVSQGGYRWLNLDARATALRCDGACVVAVQGQPPRSAPLEPAVRPIAAVAFRVVSPFAILADVPDGPQALLRYDVSYNAHWLAVSGLSVYEHERIDATTNGWRLPARARRTTVLIINAVAAIECSAIILSMAFTSYLVWTFVKLSFRR